MANSEEKKVGTTTEGEPEVQNMAEETGMVATTPKKPGVMTFVKIGCVTLGAVALTGLGWTLRGVFGGGDSDGDEECTAETEQTEE
jgi:hypothetical protein